MEGHKTQSIYIWLLLRLCLEPSVFNTSMIFCSVAVQGDMPRFVIEPQSLFWHQGSAAAVLVCNTEPSDASIRWVYNGSLITTKRGTAAISGRLVLDSSSKWEQGRYQCIANNSEGAVLSSVAYVGKACEYL